MPFGRESRKISLGSKPHLLVGTMLGTLATFVVFVNHYTTLKDDGSGARATGPKSSSQPSCTHTYSPWLCSRTQVRRGCGSASAPTAAAAATMRTRVS